MIKPAEFVYSFIHVTLSYDFFLTLGACEKIFKEINFLRGKNSRMGFFFEILTQMWWAAKKVRGRILDIETVQ